MCDLPGRGDCCFPALVHGGRGRYTVYDYSSALRRPNRPWILGQLTPTGIYEIDLQIDRPEV